MKPIMSKITIKVENGDGTFTELEMVMPKPVSDDILLCITTWKESYLFTPEYFEKYQKAEAEFCKEVNEAEKPQEKPIMQHTVGGNIITAVPLDLESYREGEERECFCMIADLNICNKTGLVCRYWQHKNKSVCTDFKPKQQ